MWPRSPARVNYITCLTRHSISKSWHFFVVRRTCSLVTMRLKGVTTQKANQTLGWHFLALRSTLTPSMSRTRYFTRETIIIFIQMYLVFYKTGEVIILKSSGSFVDFQHWASHTIKKYNLKLVSLSQCLLVETLNAHAPITFTMYTRWLSLFGI
jgi:hypothetical protein